MTQEEKAKAYDEALEDMKVIYPNLKGDIKLAVEHAFPELKESEDERIRKSIIKLLQVGGYMSPSDKTKAFAYLEKQKEQKPAEWSEEDETAYGDLIWCIEQAKKSAKDENDMGNIWFAENWVKNHIKSLRPQSHWKPTEEQMKALARATNRCVGVDDAKILIKLLEQLKKL